jgi:glycerol-3-phosphate dehydrogenase subunit C
MNALPETEVEVIEQCSAVDGTWGMKAQHYEMGRRYARKLVDGIEAASPKAVVTDCALAARRILAENGLPAVHPVEVLADAYGLTPDVT